ncbi:hypothetical protein K450DRAFT_253071 [Umbelopsis ramanniana AG]|uniref:Uncharacterized protein n=1 Tax=Umbelopsis ramanniana AG TaxID=1314678 RepID=A0AAD5HAP0_UMBRA|nr:uncharacterized protein K450DRAFT_253071 [Umbelopsis ramanniana AG]KAI8577142.1 hypothetical protein K450DRAFT_253071 [Umbelopsis ramanniana AG]
MYLVSYHCQLVFFIRQSCRNCLWRPPPYNLKYHVIINLVSENKNHYLVFSAIMDAPMLFYITGNNI